MSDGGGRRRVVIAALLLLAASFVALAMWQVERRAWKHALIAAVDARLARPPVAAPSPGDPAAGEAYTRVALSGRYLSGLDTEVRAVTDLGSGRWVLTPFDTGALVILVNRGFVPAGKRAAPPPAGTVRVTGLLRLSEPGGGFLRANDPSGDRWFSRDVAAIARARGLPRAAPYFVDADAGPPGYPRGGMTVVRFSDKHAGYALTWFALAAMALGAAWALGRRAPAVLAR